MLISPLEIEFIFSLLGVKVPKDPAILARALPGIYEISKELRKGTKVPHGYGTGNAVNTSPYKDLSGSGYDCTPCDFEYANLQTPGPLSPTVMEMIRFVRELPDMQPSPSYGGPASTMQPVNYFGARPQDEIQLDRDYRDAQRGDVYAQHLAASAPVTMDYPGYSNMGGGGYNLVNAVNNSPVPPSLRYGRQY